MAIGILYESNEWSSYAFRDDIISMGVPAKLINLLTGVNEEALLSCDLIVNRVFASAAVRGHRQALDRIPDIIPLLEKNGIPMINPAGTYFYEVSKEHTVQTLAAHGFPVPAIYGSFMPAQWAEAAGIQYPCIVKPDCGGRTTYTFLVNNPGDLEESMSHVPDLRFIAQEYMVPEYGYLTRVEVIGGACRSILKRSIAENGLSAYHLGSAYTDYADCPIPVQDASVQAMDLLQVEIGSLDIIENTGGFYIIDVNSVSNATEDNIEAFHFDLIRETAAYVVQRYRELKEHF